jgi:hypothetical protein
MNSIDTPLYKSTATLKSIGNEYSIYADRIELKCRFPFITKTLIINKDDIISIDTFKPPVRCTSIKALKLDLADLNEHVGINRKNGFFKQIRFTPKSPKEFVAKVKELFKL